MIINNSPSDDKRGKQKRSLNRSTQNKPSRKDEPDNKHTKEKFSPGEPDNYDAEKFSTD
jgi:hypothetical protein